MAFKKKVIEKEEVVTSSDITNMVISVEDPKLHTLKYSWVEIDCKVEFIKSHPDAQLPTKAHEGDNCWDLYAVEEVHIPPSFGISKNGITSGVTIGSAVVDVGISLANITPGYGFVFKPRSGLGFKHGIYPHNGEIDNGYRGGLAVKMYNFKGEGYTVKKGDRVCQFKIERIYNTAVSFTDVVTNTARGDGGFGSSGK